MSGAETGAHSRIRSSTHEGPLWQAIRQVLGPSVICPNHRPSTHKTVSERNKLMGRIVKGGTELGPRETRVGNLGLYKYQAICLSPGIAVGWTWSCQLYLMIRRELLQMTSRYDSKTRVNVHVSLP